MQKLSISNSSNNEIDFENMDPKTYKITPKENKGVSLFS